jgi:hypothetical protein
VIRLLALTALFAAGLLLSFGLDAVGAADTTTETTTTTLEQTTTEPTTVVTTATLEQTTTRRVTVPTTGTTTAETKSASTTPTWVWVVLAVLAAAAIGLLIAFLTRRGGGVPPLERRRRLDGAIGSWVAQGWAVESQTGDAAVLRRGAEAMVVSVDDAGRIATQPLR